jgi:MbtH protein
VDNAGEHLEPLEQWPYQSYYRVVVNDETCFAMWPTGLSMPAGWVATGFTGTALACLRQVAELWRNRGPQLDPDSPCSFDDSDPSPESEGRSG